MVRPAFPASGYAVFYLQVSQATIDELYLEAESRTYRPVFREVGGAEDDIFRSQSRVQRMTLPLRRVSAAILEDAATRDSNYRPCVFSYMHSRPGGQYQEPHQDYADEVRAAVHARYPGSIPASVIIAIQPGTRLRLFPRCFDFARPEMEIELEIPTGYAVVFRGDLFHSGVGYTTSNYRLHCYLFFRDLGWRPDVVSNSLLVCQYCGRTERVSARIRQHRYFCLQKPDGLAHRIARREQQNRRGEYPCNYCSQVFEVQSTLRSHILAQDGSTSSHNV
ncbi:hypothetical protein PHYSODRAFT_521703 [Phytophthora sojae]|uniref:C2H2-type domain-containing protein n=1 Tax=Phytophthora sojae (strain P6497) TaxID=1094619 RepID=G5A2C8_PHYSP|nr:hypothetical protein PHYSODRAFT_521703 [Phytophthora sojae]EGZ09819.1 hypothetical protein PHYSODRAFT_521703 [Phytophthora sojae]|eukprot:XP_009534680.1 hypothetical protein PHYSODRAFT_521703 [Phytophthora sojae]